MSHQFPKASIGNFGLRWWLNNQAWARLIGFALPDLEKNHDSDFKSSSIPNFSQDRGGKTISIEKWQQVKLRKIKENLNSPQFWGLSQGRLRCIQFFPILAKKLGRIRILLDFPQLLEENVEGFDLRNPRKAEDIFSFHPDLEKSWP